MVKPCLIGIREQLKASLFGGFHGDPILDRPCSGARNPLDGVGTGASSSGSLQEEHERKKKKVRDDFDDPKVRKMATECRHLFLWQ